jgi:hypothetical protein
MVHVKVDKENLKKQDILCQVLQFRRLLFSGLIPTETKKLFRFVHEIRVLRAV